MTSLWSPLWRTLWLMAHFVMWWRHIGWWLIHITWPLYVLPLYKFHQIDFSILYAFTCDWINELTIVHWSIFKRSERISLLSSLTKSYWFDLLNQLLAEKLNFSTVGFWISTDTAQQFSCIPTSWLYWSKKFEWVHEQRNRNRFISSFHFHNDLRSFYQYLLGTVSSSFFSRLYLFRLHFHL